MRSQVRLPTVIAAIVAFSLVLSAGAPARFSCRHGGCVQRAHRVA
ncbi:MAG: hypothetical protein R2851_13715 [Caldilineaceae bacterium]